MFMLVFFILAADIVYNVYTWSFFFLWNVRCSLELSLRFLSLGPRYHYAEGLLVYGLCWYFGTDYKCCWLEVGKMDEEDIRIQIWPIPLPCSCGTVAPDCEHTFCTKRLRWRSLKTWSETKVLLNVWGASVSQKLLLFVWKVFARQGSNIDVFC